MTTWQFVLRLIRFSPGVYFIAFILQILRLTFILLPGLIIRQIFNILTGNAEAVAFWDVGFGVLIALLIGVAVARVCILLGAIYVEYTAAFYSSALLRKNIFSHLLDIKNVQGLPFPAGDIVSRLEGDSRLIADFVRILFYLSGLMISAIVALYIMLQINVLITVLVVIPIFVIGIMVNFASSNLGKLRRERRKADSSIGTFLAEIFGAVQAVQISSAEESVITHFQQLNAKRREAALKENMFQDVLMSGFENIKHVFIGIILLLSGLMLAGEVMQSSVFTLGDFALFVAYLVPMSDFTVEFGRTLASYQQVKISWDRLGQLVEKGESPNILVEYGPVYLKGDYPEVPFIQKTENHQLLTLEATNLTYMHPSTKRGVETVDLKIERGSVTVIAGRVGSGKTTLLRTLLGLLPKDGGEIRWNGRLVENPATFFAPPKTAYTPQIPRLFSQTVKENILMGLPEAKVSLSQAVHQAVMEHDIEMMEDGLETMVGPKGVKLSGGQVQRTAAARMFICEPELLIFDDLSSALDVNTEQILWRQIFEKETVTALVVSHRQTAFRHADKIIVLKDGRVAGEGTLEQLLKTSAEFQEIWQGHLGENGDKAE